MASLGLHASASPSPAGQIYAGYDPNAPWRKPAEDRIERIRKGDLQVVVRDHAGHAVPDATVHVRMLRHAFIFGSEVEPEIILDQTRPDSAIYRQKLAATFNTTVFGHHFEWGPWEAPDLQAEAARATVWLESQGIAQRGHSLLWPSCGQGPPDVCGLTGQPKALRKRIARHISEKTTVLAGHVVEWDVLNEPYMHHDLVDLLGTGAMVKWFKLAHRGDPAARLYLNEFGALEDFGGIEDRQNFIEDTVRYLKRNGAPIGGVGLESHFVWPPTPPEEMLATLDRLGALGVALEGTEFDVDVADETLQADFTYDYLTVMFSHPAVVGVLVWGFWEGNIDKPNSALYRMNWSLKPAGQVWLDLTHNQWSTDTEGRTGTNGVYATRGFLGDYEITVDAAGLSRQVTTSLPKSGVTVRITLR